MASVVGRDQTTTATCVARSDPPLTGIAHEVLSGAAVKLAVLRDRVASLFQGGRLRHTSSKEKPCPTQQTYANAPAMH